MENTLDIVFGGHGVNTDILMYSGAHQPLHSLKVGDSVMGPDGRRRMVLAVAHSDSSMMKIEFQAPAVAPLHVASSTLVSVVTATNSTPSTGDIDPHTTSESTVESLQLDTLLEMQDADEENKFFYRARPMLFPYKQVPIEPIALGVLIFSFHPCPRQIGCYACRGCFMFHKAEIIERAIVGRDLYDAKCTGDPLSPALQDAEDFWFASDLPPKPEPGTFLSGITNDEAEATGAQFYTPAGSTPKSLFSLLSHLKELSTVAGSTERRLPRSYINNDELIRLWLLAGIVTACGSVTEGIQVQIPTIHQALIKDFQLLCTSLGIKCSDVPSQSTATQAVFKLTGGLAGIIPHEANFTTNQYLSEPLPGYRFSASPSDEGETIAIRVSVDNTFLRSDGLGLRGQNLVPRPSATRLITAAFRAAPTDFTPEDILGARAEILEIV